MMFIHQLCRFILYEGLLTVFGMVIEKKSLTFNP